MLHLFTDKDTQIMMFEKCVLANIRPFAHSINININFWHVNNKKIILTSPLNIKYRKQRISP